MAKATKGKYGNVAAWCSIGGREYYFRSKAERNYCFFLEWQRSQGIIERWQKEEKTWHWKNRLGRPVQYKPDFFVVPKGGYEAAYWVEVKGYMDARSKSKIDGFRLNYPEETLIVIDSKWFAKQNKILKGLVPGWQ